MELRKLFLALFLAFSLNAFSQPNFFMWHNPNSAPTLCDTESTFPGGVSYPTTIIKFMGTDVGFCNFNYNAYNVPDRFMVYYNSFLIYDSGYRGNTGLFNFGGSQRTNFTNSLTGKIDPEFGTTYPDFTNFTDDGYPLVSAPTGVRSLYKGESSNYMTVKVYAPMSSTIWTFTLTCPI